MKTLLALVFIASIAGCSNSPETCPKAPLQSTSQITQKPYDNTVRDDSDPPNGRSGLWVLIDSRTGCQYLGWDGAYNRGAAITPRMDEIGKQVCK